MKKYPFSIFFIAVILLCSCSPKITTTINTSEDTTMVVYCAIPPVLSDLLYSFTGTGARELISPEEIKSTLNDHGISVLRCSINTNDEFSLSTAHISPVTLPLPVTTTASSISLSLSPAIMQNILTLLPADTAATFDLLMAPVLTGEKMTTEEYVSLISSVYGGKTASELEKSQLTLELSTPSPATLTIKKGTTVQSVSSNTTTLLHRFSVAQLLTLQDTVILTVSW